MKNNSVDILNRIECTGCSVCEKVCPHNAIEMIETKEGFHYPLIDEDKCTNCGLCVKKCHALNDNFKTDFKQEIYDVRASDDIRMKSSSGGMFTILANYVLENNGYVCGVSFTKDWLGVEHIIINDKKDLDKIRGSKYIESNLGNIFIEIKKLLNEKKQVLFSGCPCQVSALYSYLGKDYDNLITVDLLCNSIVPQKVWKKYLKELFTDEEIKDIEYISFRDKEKFGWGRGIYIKLKNNKEYIKTKNECIYNKLFTEHISVKIECLKCKYRKFDRVGDFSIGDYWGVKDHDNNGVSLVLLNSEKSKNIFNNINTYFLYTSLLKASNGGLKDNIFIFFNRKYFFDNLDKEDLNTLYENSSNISYNVGIVNMCFQDNYGGALTYYALYKIIEQFGYNPFLIYDNNIKYIGNNNSIYDDAIGNQFALKYMNVANSTFSNEELKKINNITDTFLVGSDQVWRYEFHRENIFYYLFNFIDNSKKKIAYSSSFGIPYYEGDYNSKAFFKYYLNQFDYISVREDDAVELSKNEFGVETTHVLDPVFLLDIKYYDYLISKSKLNIKYKYIASYLRRGDSDLDKYLSYASDILSLEIFKTGKVNFNSKIEYDKSFSIEDWLYMIKNCDFFISDSFHGICFAIIFNKPFVLVTNNGAISKYKSLIRMFKLESRTINKFEEILENTNMLSNMDFSEINKILEQEKNKSLEWIRNALFSDKKIKDNDYKNDIINILIKENNELKININRLNNTIIPKLDNKINQISGEFIRLNNEKIEFNNEIRHNRNWIKFFDIYNTNNYIFVYLFGIKLTFKVNENRINKISWWIPVKKWRDSFRAKFKSRAEQSRAEQSRAEQSRACKEYIQYYNNSETKKLQPMLQYQNAA